MYGRSAVPDRVIFRPTPYLPPPDMEPPNAVPLFDQDAPLDNRRTRDYTALNKNWSTGGRAYNGAAAPPDSMRGWQPNAGGHGGHLQRTYSTISQEWNEQMKEDETYDVNETTADDVIGESIVGGGRTDLTVADMKYLMDSHGAAGSSVLQKDYKGQTGLCRRLRTSPTHGLYASPEDMHERLSQFGENVFPILPLKSYIRLVAECLINDVTLMIILIAGIVALGLSFYKETKSTTITLPDGTIEQDFVLTEEESEMNIEWVEGAFKIIMVILVVLISTINDWYQDRHFRTLQGRIKTESRHSVPVIRFGQVVQVPVTQLAVGDVCILVAGHTIPADGVVVSCDGLRVDELLLTDNIYSARKDLRNDPFLLTGTIVNQGSGRMVVTAVGSNTQAGIIMQLIGARTAINSRSKFMCCLCCKKKPAHGGHGGGEHGGGHEGHGINAEEHGGENAFDHNHKAIIHHPEEQISIELMIAGVLFGVLTMIIWYIRYSVDTFIYKGVTFDQTLNWNFVYYFVRGIQVVLVAVPEGLPIVIAVATAFQAWRMRRDHIFVRYLKSGESMGHTTTIVTDMTGVITTGRFMVVHNYLCEKYYRGVEDLKDIPPLARDLLSVAIAVNTRYETHVIPPSSEMDFTTRQIGDRTECALLRFLRELGCNYEPIRLQFPKQSFIWVYPYSAQRRSRSTVVLMPNGAFMLFSMGPADTMLKSIWFRCSSILGDDGLPDRLTVPYQQALKGQVLNLMDSYGLRSVAIAYREFPPGASPDWRNENVIFRDLVCISILGIEDPIRPEMPQTMRKCRLAGINVCMISDENINTTRSIAYKCGLLQAHDDTAITMSADEFAARTSEKHGHELVNQHALDQIWPRLRVLAGATPTQKNALVRGVRNSHLTHDHGVVACTGRHIDDGPAMKSADTGYSLSFAGTAVVKKVSDVVLLDDSFTSFMTSIMWGRNIYDSIAKFTQFQVAIILVGNITLISTAIGYLPRAPVIEIQMVWACLVVAVMIAIGMAMEAPNEELYRRKPVPRHQHLCSYTMTKNIFLHSAYQIFVVFLLYGCGNLIMDVDDGRLTPQVKTEHFTVVFNTFILMLFVNAICSRCLHNELNMFRGLHRNPGFIVILCILFIAQVMIVQFGAPLFFTNDLTIDEWAWCLFFSLFEFVWAMIISFIPFERLFVFCCPPIVSCFSVVFGPCTNCECCGQEEVEGEPIYGGSGPHGGGHASPNGVHPHGNGFHTPEFGHDPGMQTLVYNKPTMNGHRVNGGYNNPGFVEPQFHPNEVVINGGMQPRMTMY